MTLQELKIMSDALVQAIHDYKSQDDFNEIELERTLDELLCKLPRDIVYVEWFDRSQIKDMADGVYDEPVESEDLVDSCMFDLWDNTNSMMDSDSIYSSVVDTIRNNKEGASYED